MFVRTRRLSYVSHARVPKHFVQLTGTAPQASSQAQPLHRPSRAQAPPMQVPVHGGLGCAASDAVLLVMLAAAGHALTAGRPHGPQARRSSTADLLQHDVLDRYRPRWLERWRVSGALAVSGKSSTTRTHPLRAGIMYPLDVRRRTWLASKPDLTSMMLSVFEYSGLV